MNQEEQDINTITRKQWYAIGFVVCLLIALFFLKHGDQLKLFQQ